MPITSLRDSIGSNHSTMETIMTSTTIYTITPTYLYIKQHSVTGIKYFGKTTQDPYQYKGSGKYWKNHINKHGKEFVETIWLSEPYTNKDLLSEFALFFSEEYDIVKSDKWANLNPENGLDGGQSGPRSDETKAKISASNIGKKQKPHSAESNEKRSKTLTGKTRSIETKAKITATLTGKTHSVETKAKMSASHTGNIKPKVKCPHCNFIGGGGAMKQWHFDNCKLRPM